METPGSLIDKLIVTNLKIWKLEDLKRLVTVTDKELADATRKTNLLNQQRNDLIQEYDELITDMVQGKVKVKNYKQGETKSYGQ